LPNEREGGINMGEKSGSARNLSMKEKSENVVGDKLTARRGGKTNVGPPGSSGGHGSWS